MSSPHVGIWVGRIEKPRHIWLAGFSDYLDRPVLDQAQLNGPFDRRPAAIDVEFAVDALGMGAHRAQSDHEFTGYLGARKLSLEQPEHFELTLAEWFNLRLWQWGK